MRELFGSAKPGLNDEVLKKSMEELRQENSRLFFELKSALDTNHEDLERQAAYLDQLSEFARAIMSLDDKAIESNLQITIAKRNRAPQYASIETDLE